MDVAQRLWHPSSNSGRSISLYGSGIDSLFRPPQRGFRVFQCLGCFPGTLAGNFFLKFLQLTFNWESCCVLTPLG